MNGIIVDANVIIDVLTLAIKVFHQYRKNAGKKSKPLPDFSIGAHAQVKKYTILSRDLKPYQTYFPQVTVIAPELATV